jgi:redox-sensing transcriptional repressor
VEEVRIKNMDIVIPKVTAKRLPIYHRYLERLASLGIRRVSSAELSRSLNIDPATIRRDLSYLGALGRKGYGYDVDYLIQFLKQFLKQDVTTHVVLVGVGNLGTALLQYDFLKNNAMIVAAFDSDHRKVGREVNSIPIYPLDQLEEIVDEEEPLVAILTVPVQAAQEVTDRLISVGIKGILNFTPTRLKVPDDVKIHYIDLSVELQSLIYFLKKNEPVVMEQE